VEAVLQDDVGRTREGRRAHNDPSEPSARASIQVRPCDGSVQHNTVPDGTG